MATKFEDLTPAQQLRWSVTPEGFRTQEELDYISGLSDYSSLAYVDQKLNSSPIVTGTSSGLDAMAALEQKYNVPINTYGTSVIPIGSGETYYTQPAVRQSTISGSNLAIQDPGLFLGGPTSAQIAADAMAAEVENIIKQQATQAPVDPFAKLKIGGLFDSLIKSGRYQDAAIYAESIGVPASVTADYVNQNAVALNLGPETGFQGVSTADVQSLYTGNVPTTNQTNTGTNITNTGTNITSTGTNITQTGTSPLAGSNEFINAVRNLDFSTAGRIASQLGLNAQQTAEFINQNASTLGLGPNFGGVTAANIQSFFPTELSSLPTAGASKSNIDPIIAPYLQEALGQARSLFLGGPGPQLYPGQMYVEPSAQTEAALTQMEQLAGLSQPYFMQAQEGLTQGMRGLQETATGGFLQGSPYREQLIEAATRPITQQFTEQVMPGIQSTFSQAGRLGSGAQAAVTGRAAEGFGRALGDVTSQIAAADYARERGFQEQAQRDVINAVGQFGDVFTSFLAPAQTLAQVGAQREAIAAQPLQESIRRFEYAQQLPYQQLGGYLSSIYGSPLASQNAPTQQQQGNTLLQDIGGLVNIAGGLGRFGQTDLGKSTFNFLGIPGF